jgi:hypothetical protein
VANGTDGTCKIFRGDNFQLIASVPLGANANHVGYDPATKYLYVGIGIPDSPLGALAITASVGCDRRSSKRTTTSPRPCGSSRGRSATR